MRRRLARVLPATLLSVALLLPATAATAVAAEPASLVLAAEPAEGEAPGPEPKQADNTDNEFAPTDYEANWTALLAGRALFVLILLVAVLIGIGYWVRVGRFPRETRQS